MEWRVSNKGSGVREGWEHNVVMKRRGERCRWGDKAVSGDDKGSVRTGKEVDKSRRNGRLRIKGDMCGEDMY